MPTVPATLTDDSGVVRFTGFLTATLGGGSAFLDRHPAADVTLEDGFCAVAVDYYHPQAALVLQGDAVLQAL